MQWNLLITKKQVIFSSPHEIGCLNDQSWDWKFQIQADKSGLMSNMAKSFFQKRDPDPISRAFCKTLSRPSQVDLQGRQTFSTINYCQRVWARESLLEKLEFGNSDFCEEVRVPEELESRGRQKRGEYEPPNPIIVCFCLPPMFHESKSICLSGAAVDRSKLSNFPQTLKNASKKIVGRSGFRTFEMTSTKEKGWIH